MGMFDDVVAGDRAGQVKLWDCSLRCYRPGDKVPTMCADGDPMTYSVAMREGGYLNIEADVLVGWTDEPRHGTVLDKWGDAFDEQHPRGLIEGYWFDRDKAA